MHNELKSLIEIVMPTRSNATGKYEYMPHLYIHGENASDLLPGFYIKNYENLKADLEKSVGKPIASVKQEKSTTLKALELLEM